MTPKQCSAAREVLSALDADPALVEHYDPDEIEAISLACVLARLDELGLAPAIPVKLQQLLSEPTSPAADVLSALADDLGCLQPQNIEARPLAEVIACLQRDGINYRAGIAAIIDFAAERASRSASVDEDQTKVRSIKLATLERRKSLFLTTIGSAAAATAAAATVGFFVVREARQDAVATTAQHFVTRAARQDKVIADQRYEIRDLSEKIQWLQARLKQLGGATDDLKSVTIQVPPRYPDERVRPPGNDDGNAAAMSVAAAPEQQGAGGSGSPDNAAPASGGVAPEAPRARSAWTLERQPYDARKRSFDGFPSPPGLPVSPEAPFTMESPNLRAWVQAMRTGDNEGGIRALEEAARNGDVPAVWKLGRIYAEGDRVKKDDLRAFEYFRSIAEMKHVEDMVGTSQAGFVANALVALGEYYLNGIPIADIEPDPVQARQKFYYAATFFGDANAQYHLGRMYLDGLGGAKDTKNAARWLYAAAMKGQHEAQAVFGGMLFTGQSVPRDAAKGLMFLKLAVDAATPSETWIADQFNAAWKQATEDERAVAMVYLEQWRRDHPGHGYSGEESKRSSTTLQREIELQRKYFPLPRPAREPENAPATAPGP